MRIGLMTFVCLLVVATVVATNRHGCEAESTLTADQADNAPSPEQRKSESPLDFSPGPTAVSWASKMLRGVQNYDFGSVPYGESPQHRFLITNIYAVPMKITSIRYGCACVSVTSSPSTGESLAPGAEGWIEVTLDSRRFYGHTRTLLHITFGPEHVGAAAIEITANVQAPE